jgi:hypothetical protein
MGRTSLNFGQFEKYCTRVIPAWKFFGKTIEVKNYYNWYNKLHFTSIVLPKNFQAGITRVQYFSNWPKFKLVRPINDAKIY